VRTIVFADVHGNLPALEAMLRHAGAADRFVCLGDVVNYGPWSDECVDRIEALPDCTKLTGNHDAAFLAGTYDGTHPVARAFFDFCWPRFHRREPLTRYEASTEVGCFRAQHTLDDRYVFADTPVELDANYLIGHSHHQFQRTVNGFELINAGSVGQNRARLDIVNYVVCGPGPRDAELVAFSYDPAPVIAEMRRLGYPAPCVDYYVSKLRS
jgi:predicted phosphodiesterase